MSYLLDTNICSAYLKQPGKVAHRFFQHSGGLFTSTIVLAELYTWAYRRENPNNLLQLIETELLNNLILIDFDRNCARQFGNLRAATLNKGLVINPIDLLIASVALTNNLTLVTHNVRHFQVIESLRIEDWLEG